MKRILFRTVVLSAVLLVSVALLSKHSGAVSANPIDLDVTGFWSGDFASVSGATGFASLDLTDLNHRRFEGTFVFTTSSPIVPPNPCFVLGTVARSGEISLVGENADFFLHAHGQTDGTVMNLNYSLHFADGSMDMGTASVSILTGGGT